MLSFQWSCAQNLVLNPDFENTNGDFCGILAPGDYSATAMNWYSPSQGTPDLYFTNINSSCWNYQPNSTYGGPIGLKGTQLPRSGNVMSGIFLYTISGFEQREYIQVPLSSPLTIGGKYVVECYVSLADYTEFATDRLGIYLSTQPVSVSSDGVLNYTPQVLANGVISNIQDWVRVADTLIATEAHSYLTIGNFSTDAQTPTTSNPTNSGQPGTYGAYYFVDDVRIERVTGGPVGLVELEGADRTLVKIIDLMGRETTFKPNTPLIYIYSDGTSERVMKISE
jgi:hypothetical protein